MHRKYIIYSMGTFGHYHVLNSFLMREYSLFSPRPHQDYSDMDGNDLTFDEQSDDEVVHDELSDDEQ